MLLDEGIQWITDTRSEPTIDDLEQLVDLYEVLYKQFMQCSDEQQTYLERMPKDFPKLANSKKAIEVRNVQESIRKEEDLRSSASKKSTPTMKRMWRKYAKYSHPDTFDDIVFPSPTVAEMLFEKAKIAYNENNVADMYRLYSSAGFVLRKVDNETLNLLKENIADVINGIKRIKSSIAWKYYTGSDVVKDQVSKFIDALSKHE